MVHQGARSSGQAVNPCTLIPCRGTAHRTLQQHGPHPLAQLWAGP